MELNEENYYKIYYDPKNGLATAHNLIVFGLRQILQVKHMKDIEELKSILLKDGKLIEPPKFPDINRLGKFIFEGLIDSIRISICFENYMKALMLSNGYVIHVLSQKKDYKDLYENQKDEPILVNELLKSDEFELDQKKEYHTHPAITKYTIGFRTLIKDKYREIHKIPDEIINIVTNFYDRRNNIHLYFKETFQYGEKTIKELCDLYNFATGSMIKNNNKLVDILKGPDSQKIDPRKIKPLTYKNQTAK